MWMLVLNALMPLVAQAMPLPAAGAVDVAFEICTSTGMVVLAGEQNSPSEPSDAPLGMSCPFCVLHDGQALLPPAAFASILMPVHADMPPVFYKAADTSGVWLAALSRGPPLFLS